MSLDFRRAERARVAISAEAEGEGRGFECVIRDFSPWGCFVGTEELLEAGSEVKLTLLLPNASEETHVAGTVIRCAGRSDDHIGFGVEFNEPLEDLWAPGGGESI